ncbi:MAG: aspartate-semialdehyde dehydrogenase [Myxococcales bacterium]
MATSQRESETYTVGIVGATGLVGREIARLLAERRFPVEDLLLFATEDSEGTRVAVGEDQVSVKVLRSGWHGAVDLVFLAVPPDVAAVEGRAAAAEGIAVIDVSSAHRFDPDALLCVPEINGAALDEHGGIIACPSAPVAPLAVALAAVIDPRQIERIAVTVLLPASEGGIHAMEELSDQSIALFNQKDMPLQHFPERLAFNAIPVVGTLGPDGEATAEASLRAELRSLFSAPGLDVIATVVRVPLFSGQAASVVVDCRTPVDRQALRARLSASLGSHGVELVDEGHASEQPLPGTVSEVDAVQVGRVRTHGPRTFSLWVVSDNLRKGSALNAVQIAERLVADGLL